MLDPSRKKIYDFLCNVFNDVVTKNVYPMSEPQELTQSDVADGFLVIHVGEIMDESEFSHECFGWARCYVEAFVPPKKRGRVDLKKYGEFEDGINSMIEIMTDADGEYYIEEGSTLSMDAYETSNADNTFFTFVKSFIVVIDKQTNN